MCLGAGGAIVVGLLSGDVLGGCAIGDCCVSEYCIGNRVNERCGGVKMMEEPLDCVLTACATVGCGSRLVWDCWT